MASTSPKVYQLKLNIGASTDASLKDSINAINSNLLSTGIKANLVASGIKKAFSFTKDVVLESIETGKAFEKTLDNVQSISKASIFQMEAMHDISLKLGGKTAFSANQSAEALQFMSQAGWTADKSLAALNDTVNLAAAGDVNLANAAEITTDNINAFKLEAKDAGRLADALATGANKSSTNVMGLGAALQYAAPLAGAMGYTIEDTVKTLGWLADSGIKGQKAGTALRRIIANLTDAQNDSSKKGTKASRAMKALGISMRDAKGKAKSLDEVVSNLRESFSKLSKEQKTKYALDLGGKIGVSALLALVNTSKENVDKLNNAFKNTSGTAKEMAEIRMDNLSGDMKKLSGYTETLNVKLYEGMLPYLRESAQTLRENLGLAEDKIPTISEGIGEMTLSLTKMSKPAMEMMSFAVENREILSGLIVGHFGGKALMTGGALTINTFTKVKDTIKDFKNNGLRDSVSGALSFGKIGLIVGLIATAIGGIVGLKKHFDRVAQEKNISEHFGNVALSLDEINTISKDIIYQGNIDKIQNSFKMFEELDEINDEIERLQKNRHRIGLKIKAGIELTEEDKEELLQNAKDTVSETQKYFEQNKISVLEFTSGLNSKDLGEELSESLLSGLEKNSQKVSLIGDKWIKFINQAMKDGVISNEELLKINEFSQEIFKLQQRVESARRRAAMDIAIDKAIDKGLSKESLVALNVQITENLRQSELESNKALSETIALLQIQRENGEISQEKYDTLIQGLKDDVAETKLKNKAHVMGKIGDELYKRYKEEFKNQSPNETDFFMEDVRDFLTNGSFGEGGHMPSIYEPLNPTSKKVIKGILKEDGMYKLYEDYKKELESLKENGVDISKYSKKTKKMDSLYNATFGVDPEAYKKETLERFLNSPKQIKESYKYAKKEGFNVNDALAYSIDKGMTAGELRSKLEAGGKEAELLWRRVLETTFEKEYVIELDIKPDIKLKKDKFKPDISDSYHVPEHIRTNRRAVEPMNNADGGIYSSPILTYVAEGKSAEAIIPLDNRPRSRRLLDLANEVMGHSGNGGDSHIVFSPVINISGNADKNDVMQALRQSYEVFENNMSRYLERNARVCL